MYRPAWILGLHCLIVLPLTLIATSFAHATCGDWLQHQDLELNSLSDFRASAHRTPTWIAAAEVTGRILFPPAAGNDHGQKCRQAPFRRFHRCRHRRRREVKRLYSPPLATHGRLRRVNSMPIEDFACTRRRAFSLGWNIRLASSPVSFRSWFFRPFGGGCCGFAHQARRR